MVVDVDGTRVRFVCAREMENARQSVTPNHHYHFKALLPVTAISFPRLTIFRCYHIMPRDYYPSTIYAQPQEHVLVIPNSTKYHIAHPRAHPFLRGSLPSFTIRDSLCAHDIALSHSKKTFNDLFTPHDAYYYPS